MTVKPPKSAVYITPCPFAAGGPARAFAITERQGESATQIVPQPENLAKLVTAEEWTAIRSQVVTSSATHAPNSSQVVMSSCTNRDLARRIEALETRYDEQFSQVFDAIKQLISEDKTRKSKRPIGFL